MRAAIEISKETMDRLAEALDLSPPASKVEQEIEAPTLFDFMGG